jgi:hypothetical protein
MMAVEVVVEGEDNGSGRRRNDASMILKLAHEKNL